MKLDQPNDILSVNRLNVYVHVHGFFKSLYNFLTRRHWLTVR